MKQQQEKVTTEELIPNHKKDQEIQRLIRGMKKLLIIIGLCTLFVSSILAQDKSVSPEVIFANLKKPTSIYATQQHLFVVESGKNRILKLDLLGNLVTSTGTLGSGDYQFDTPIDVDATNGLRIYISDNRNNRIQIFDKRSQYLSTIRRYPRARSSRPIRPTYLAVNGFNELYFYDQDSNSIISIDEQGNKLDEFQLPREIREVNDIQSVGKDLYILDLKSKQYHILAYNGVQLRSYPLEGANQLYVDKDGEEWLISKTSIRNSRENKAEIIFPEELTIIDVTKLNGVFYILTNKSVLIVEAE